MVVSFIIYNVLFLPSPPQCTFINSLIQCILLWHKVKAACDKKQTFPSLCLDFSAQVAEGWHSMYLGLFITEKVTVGVVATVCQGSNALKPLTVSLAQVVGSPYDKRNLVEGS